jgi:uncharacterized protein YqgQ
MKNYPSVGVQISDLFLPNLNIDLSKWAVIACDQFTSQPEYWEGVAQQVGKAPSTYHLILPEIYLGKPEEAQRLKTIQATMKEYLKNGILTPHQGMVYVERTIGSRKRRGLMLALDLENYDFTKGSQSMIRATEGTILDRLPPRIKIREQASLELPHILVLIDDPEDNVIGKIEMVSASLPLLYDFELMQSSGHLVGRAVNSDQLENQIISELEKLIDPTTFYTKYGVSKDLGLLLFAVGDGNHSLATAKSIWEKIKPVVGMNHPARYALVEIENIHDKGLEFEPIHRVLFNLKSDPVQALKKHFGLAVDFSQIETKAEMIRQVNLPQTGSHKFGLINSNGYQAVSIKNPTSTLPVATLQTFLDAWLKTGWAGQIDYVHGDDVVCMLGSQRDNAGFYLPPMGKDQLFKTVILDGALPRKTFSMGEAHEKRFYMEARKIVID